jgi:hypothetical protein
MGRACSTNGEKRNACLISIVNYNKKAFIVVLIIQFVYDKTLPELQHITSLYHIFFSDK